MTLLVPALAFLLVLLITLPVDATKVLFCGLRADIVKLLESGHNERPEEFGLTNRGHVIELFISHQDDTWTMLLTNPHGFSCVMEAGENWERPKSDLKLEDNL